MLEKGRDPHYYKIRKTALTAILEDIEFIESKREIKSDPIKKSNYRFLKVICKIIGHKYDHFTYCCKICKITNEELIRE